MSIGFTEPASSILRARVAFNSFLPKAPRHCPSACDFIPSSSQAPRPHGSFSPRHGAVPAARHLPPRPQAVGNAVPARHSPGPGPCTCAGPGPPAAPRPGSGRSRQHAPDTSGAFSAATHARPGLPAPHPQGHGRPGPCQRGPGPLRRGEEGGARASRRPLAPPGRTRRTPCSVPRPAPQLQTRLTLSALSPALPRPQIGRAHV